MSRNEQSYNNNIIFKKQEYIKGQNIWQLHLKSFDGVWKEIPNTSSVRIDPITGNYLNKNNNIDDINILDTSPKENGIEYEKMLPTNEEEEEDALYFRDGSLRNPETYINSLLERINLYNSQAQKLKIK